MLFDVDALCWSLSICAYDDDVFAAIALAFVVATAPTNIVDASFGVVAADVVVATIIVVDALVIWLVWFYTY